MPEPGRRVPRSRPPQTPARRPPGRPRPSRRTPVREGDRVAPRTAALAIVAALGGMLVLAASGLVGGPDRTPVPGGSATRMPGARPTPPTTVARRVPAAPTLLGDAVRFTRRPLFDLRGRLAEPLPRGQGYTLRLYRNGRLLRVQRPPRGTEFTFRRIELQRARTKLAVAVRGPAGEGPRSRSVTVVLDRTAPTLTLLEIPKPLVHRAEVTIRGTTEARSTVAVTNRTTGTSVHAAAPRGSFVVQVALAMGRNTLSIEVLDAARNRAARELTVERARGETTAELRLSPRRLSLAALPDSVTLEVSVADADGVAIDGARVVFSLSPPGLPTTTFEGVTEGGRARWPGVVIAREGAIAGEGLATVLVELPDGRTLRDSLSFRIR